MENLASCSPYHRCLWILLPFQQCTTVMTRTSLKGSGGKMSEQPSRIMKTHLVINISLPHLQLRNTELYQTRKVQTVSKVQQIPHFLSTWAFQCNATCVASRSLVGISSGIAQPTITLRDPTLDSTQWKSVLSRILSTRTMES